MITEPIGKIRKGFGGTGIYRVIQIRMTNPHALRIQFAPPGEYDITVGPGSIHSDKGAFADWLNGQMHTRESTAGTGTKYVPALIHCIDGEKSLMRMEVWGSEFNRPWGACVTFKSANCHKGLKKASN